MASDVQQAIEALADQGVIQGFPDGTFGPNKAMTRAQFAKLLAQIKGLQPNPAAAAHFTDVEDPEQRGWIGALVAAGLTAGTSGTTYSPNRPVQRDQAATFLVRALGLEEVAKELNLTPASTDRDRIHEAHKANVGLLEKLGLMKGYPDGSFRPGEVFKRQQAANLLYKVQQEGHAYVKAAQALLNHVEVVHQQNGTLTVKGVMKGAATVDIILREARQEGKVTAEKKGVSVTDTGAFEWTTDQRFVLPAQYVLLVTGYDAAGNVVGQLQRDVSIEAGVVQGLTEAPDLIHVYSQGKFVYFVFDEPIHRIEDESAFFIMTYGGDIREPGNVDLQDDGITVQAEFSGTMVRKATLAGVKRQAVTDKEWYESIEALLPLNNIKFGGTTEAPDLLSVKVEPFKLQAGSSAPIMAEYKFDKEVKNASDPAQFLLFLKDGTPLAGTRIEKTKKETVTVEFDVEWDDRTDPHTIKDAGTAWSVNLLRDFGGVIDRDDIAVAVARPVAVTDDKNNQNPLNAVHVRTKSAANGLQQASVDFDKGVITYTFDRSVEDVLDENDVLEKFAVVTDTKEPTTTLEDLGGDRPLSTSVKNSPKKIALNSPQKSVPVSPFSSE